MTDAKKSLYDDLMEDRTAPNSQCKVRTILAGMDEKDASAFQRAMELARGDSGQGRSRTYSAAWLTKVLRKHGHSISTTTILRHLTGACSCE